MLQLHREALMNWVVFSYSLPAKSGSGPRVSLWRRLRRLGAISLAGVHVLPARDECIEAFQWLAQEIRQAKGEALVMRVDRFEGLGDQQLIELFYAVREEDYREIEMQAGELEKMLSKRVKTEERSSAKDEFDKLRRRYADVRRVDYFDSPTGSRIAARLTEIERRVSPALPSAPKIELLASVDYRRKRWVTRPHPHVDRLACIWLIRRFIDPAATVRYAERPRTGEIAFDMDEGEFGHRGTLCTFEVICLSFGLDDPALRVIAEVVHEIDLRDGRYLRSEIAGIDAILNGWQLSDMSDAELEAQGVALFEGLYTTLSRSLAADPSKKRR